MRSRRKLIAKAIAALDRHYASDQLPTNPTIPSGFVEMLIDGSVSARYLDWSRSGLAGFLVAYITHAPANEISDLDRQIDRELAWFEAFEEDVTGEGRGRCGTQFKCQGGCRAKGGCLVDASKTRVA